MFTLIDNIKNTAGKDVSIMASGNCATLTFKHKTHMEMCAQLLRSSGWTINSVDGLVIKVSR